MEKIKFEKTKAHQRYKLKDGTIVPGTTTILGVLSKPALIIWANQLGLEGKDCRKVRDEAADIGSVVHFMVMAFLRGQEADLSDFSKAVIDKAENAFLSFLSWWNKKKYKVIATELELVHPKYKYGGTMDLIVEEEEGWRGLIDFKSGKGIYEPEMPCQLSAYEELYEFNTRLLIDWAAIVRIDKEGADFNPDTDIKTWTNLSEHWKMFQLLHQLYDLNKKLKGRDSW